MEIIIRKADINDVDGIVDIHLAAFESFFLSSLGKRFLRLYYSSFINNNEGVVYCATKEEIIVGFWSFCTCTKGN